MNQLSSISISVVTLCFIIYYFTIHHEKLHDFFIKKYGENKAKSAWVIFQRLTGVFLYGIVPLVLIIIQKLDFTSLGLTFKAKIPIWGWVLGLSSICIIINYFSSKKDDHLEIYPQIRTPQPWSKNLIFFSALTLTLYTLAYEIIFRGYLLFTCEKELDILLAIIINTAIYTLVHIPKGWKETIGSIPMGIILCWLTLKSGNIWVAFLVHISLVLSSEWFSINQHKKRLEIKQV